VTFDTFDIPGPLLITPKVFGDDRGYFTETFKEAEFESRTGVHMVQDNQSLSAIPGTVRGLHCQAPPHAQAKLVRCLAGAIMDVAVDARVGSPTYGRWVQAELSATNHAQLFVPAGFLHGFATLTPDCLVVYKVSDIYAPDCDISVRFDSLPITWGLRDRGITAPTLSAKDESAPAFSDWQSPFA